MSMRDYGKVGPKFWTGDTGKAIKARGSEAVVAAVYLMTSPASNMLGLYYQPLLYMAHETGLGIDGAPKALQCCIEADFCQYDPRTEMVWVMEMAMYQIAPSLKPVDLRCKGIQKEYDALPNCPFLGPFFERYAKAFHMTAGRTFQPPPSTQKVRGLDGGAKPGTGTGAVAGSIAGALQEHAASPLSSADADSSPAKLPTDPSAVKETKKVSKTPTIPCPYAKLIELYHKVLPELPPVRLDSEARHVAMRKLWGFALSSRKTDGSRRAETAEQALHWIGTYFERVRENDFLMGRGKRSEEHAGWRCDFDFLLTERGMRQVIEKTDPPAESGEATA